MYPWHKVKQMNDDDEITMNQVLTILPAHLYDYIDYVSGHIKDNKVALKENPKVYEEAKQAYDNFVLSANKTLRSFDDLHDKVRTIYRTVDKVK